MGDTALTRADFALHCTSTPGDHQRLCAPVTPHGRPPGAGRQCHRQARFLCWPPSRWGALCVGGDSSAKESPSYCHRPWPPRTVISDRKSSGPLRTLSRAVSQVGLGSGSRVDEVGRGGVARGHCGRRVHAGPSRLKACCALMIRRSSPKVPGEALTPLICRYALAYNVVFIPSTG